MVDRITIIFFLCNALAGFFHYLFNVIMIRLLPLGEVGDVGKLLNMLVLITIPLAAFQNVVTQSVATWTAREEYQLVRALWKRLGIDALIVGICLCGGILASASQLQKLYGLPSIWPLYVMATVPLPMVLLPTVRGILQGAHVFVTLGLNLVFEGFARVIVGVAVVMLVTRSSSGALAASTGAGILALALGMWAMRPILNRPSQGGAHLDIGEVYRYAVPAMLAQLALAAMTFMDLPILGPKFSRDDAGLYFGAETCAKAVFFLPIPLSGLMFARVAGAEAKGEPTRPLILKTLGLALTLCLGMVAVFAVAPHWILRMVGGEGKLAGASGLLVPFGFAMTGFALTYALVSYHLSRKAVGFLPPFLGMTVLQGAALWMLPYDTGSAVSVLLASSVAHLLLQLWLTFRRREISRTVSPTLLASLALLAFLAPPLRAAGNESRLPLPVMMTTRTFDPGRGEIVGVLGLGIAGQTYDQKGQAVMLTNGSRYVQLLTGFQGSMGLLPALEAGWDLPIWYTVYADPSVLTAKPSGGGIGDVSAWVKFRWWESGALSSAVWGGVKWPSGAWTGLNAAKQGTDLTGTGSQDVWAGLILSHGFEWGSLHLNIGYTITGPKTYFDATGTLIDQDDGERTVIVAGVMGRLFPGVEGTFPLVFENISRVRQHGTRVDASDIQWLAIRPSLQVRVAPDVALEPMAEFPFRGVNRQRLITVGLNFHYEF